MNYELPPLPAPDLGPVQLASGMTKQLGHSDEAMRAYALAVARDVMRMAAEVEREVCAAELRLLHAVEVERLHAVEQDLQEAQWVAVEAPKAMKEASNTMEAVIMGRDKLRAEAESFQMAYRMKADAETKAQAIEIERLRDELNGLHALIDDTEWLKAELSTRSA